MAEFSGKQVAVGGGLGVLALLAMSDSVDAGEVLRGEAPLGESVRMAAEEAGDTFDFTETPPDQHVAPGGIAEPSDGGPTTTDPRDPGGSQTTTPSEQEAIDETTDAWEEGGIIDGDNEVESRSGGSGPNIDAADDPENRLNDTDGDGEADSIDLGGLY